MGGGGKYFCMRPHARSFQAVIQLLFPPFCVRPLPPCLHRCRFYQGLRDTTTERLKSSTYMLLKWVNVSLESVKVIIKWRETCVSLKTVLTHLAVRCIDLTWFRCCISISSRMYPVASAHWPDVSTLCLMGCWCTWLPKWFSARENLALHLPSSALPLSRCL